MIFTEYHKMSISELVGLIARLNALVEDKRKERRTELLRDLRALAEAHGYQLSDLIAGVRRKGSADNATKKPRPAAANGHLDPDLDRL